VEERHHLFFYLEDRFGIPEEIFDDYLLFKRRRTWWLLKDSPSIRAAAQLKVSMVGLRAFNQVGNFLKPSTRLIQLFGHLATRARLEVDEKQLKKMLRANSMRVDLDLEDGYVILCLKGGPLGLGILIDGVVSSQLPRKGLASSEQTDATE
jgi:NOL1/NOP2/fmu family ribosome biogenesis protein